MGKGALLARPLRLVLVWHGEPLEERVIRHAVPIILGSRKGATFSIPEASLGPEHVLLAPSPDGSFSLRLTPGMSGTLGFDSREVTVEDFAASQGGGASESPLSFSDWGMVAIDKTHEIAVFFQFIAPQPTLGPGAGFFDRFIGQALVFSGVVHISLLVIAFVLWEPDDGLDVDPPPSTAIAKMLLEQPPDPEKKEKPDVRKAREDASKKAAKKEGKIGDKDAKPVVTKIPKGDRDQVVKAVSNMGLLGSLKANKQSAALKSLLSDTPDATMTTAMAGLKGTELIVGRGSGGMGLRGDGPGGGGTGKGQLMGVGNLGVGGGGHGAKNTGTGGGGGTRTVVEKHVGMTTGNLSSEGGLSREQIAKVVESHKAAIQFCYEKELQRFPHLAGSIKLYWRVDPDGRVGVTRVDSSSLGNPSAESCMSRQVKNWTFPKSNGPTNVNFPFLFKGQ